MKKLVISIILTTVWSANMEYVNAGTYTFGKNDASAKSENTKEFGVTYRTHADRIAAAIKEMEQFLKESEENRDKSVPKDIVTAMKKMNTFLEKTFNFVEAIAEDVKSAKTATAWKNVLNAYSTFETEARKIIVLETVRSGLAAALLEQIVGVLDIIVDIHIKAEGDNVQHIRELVVKFGGLTTTLKDELIQFKDHGGLDPEVLADTNNALSQANMAISRAANFGRVETTVATATAAATATPVSTPAPAPAAVAPAPAVFRFF
ncbi:MAG: hypothetical protein LBC04_04610 [Holosporaceae bacterium]|jgi:hypothetical protein|nr:hypothetical protein [Holosporaceae bacterium]